MRRLILFRHAKSSWADETLSDHDRPLNPRGRKAAPKMGAWLAAQGHAPDLVLMSDSARTRETWALAAPELTNAAEVAVEPDLYHASPAAMLRRLHEAPDSARCVAMVGHMPGIGSFTRKLARSETPAACARAYKHFPTAAVAILDFDCARWADVAYGSGKFWCFACPRELP
jgi:phosphohistidine phosphatase